MNKEEIEKRLKSAKEKLKFCKFHNLSECTLSPKTIETLLNYIDKLQKENENLNKKNKRYEKYLKNKDIEHEKVLEYIETEKERDYISKDIIRNKIKELEKKDKTSSTNIYGYGIKFLKELLGE